MPPAARKKTAAGRQGTAALQAAVALLDSAEPVRRDAGGGVPLGSRGAATRLRLMEAARSLFEEQGYGPSSVQQVCDRAGVSQGTYYQYFRDRAHVMASLVDEYVAGLLGNKEMVWHIEQGSEGLRRLMHTYVTNYADHAPFARVWEEVSQIEPALAEVRRRLTRVIELTIEAELDKGVASKLIAPVKDTQATARALTSMADRYCYLTYAFDPAKPPTKPADSAELLVLMWSRALDLK